jgi:hypothetical protein
VSRSEQTSYDSHLLLTFSNPQIKKQIDQTFKPGVFVQDKKIADKEQSVVCDGSAGGERSQGACSVCVLDENKKRRRLGSRRIYTHIECVQQQKKSKTHVSI